MLPTPGPLELVIILVIALLILGPGKLPDVGAALGKGIREFRKAASDVTDAAKEPSPPAAPPASPPAAPPSTGEAPAAPPPASGEPTAESKS